MLNNETLLKDNDRRQIVVGYLSAVIEDPYNCLLEVVIHSDIPGVYTPKIRGQKTISIPMDFGTLGLNSLIDSVVRYDQKIALVGYTSVNDDGFIWFKTEAVHLMEDDDELVPTISIEKLKAPLETTELRVRPRKFKFEE